MIRSQYAGVLGLELGIFQSVDLGSCYADECVYRIIFFRLVHLLQGYSSMVDCLFNIHKALGPIPNTKSGLG